MRRSTGFSLVELLVVIGIVTLLLAILLPVLSRAREAVNRTVCLSHLRQLGAAFMMYVDDNAGAFPAGAATESPTSPARPEDWIYFQGPPNGDPARTDRPLSDSAIAPYLGRDVSAKVFLCPSDDPDGRHSGYNYSYSMNVHMQHLFQSYLHPGPPPRRGPFRMNRVRNPSEKVLLVDEDPRTINDGLWVGGYQFPGEPFVIGTDLLATRHDSGRGRHDGPGSAPLPNPQGRGNVLFGDGHADAVTREEAHSPRAMFPELR